MTDVYSNTMSIQYLWRVRIYAFIVTSPQACLLFYYRDTPSTLPGAPSFFIHKN